ncbi:Crp/Fnr family transcriptional regulator [Pelosinus propionicus]|uniref:cAMP-binding domain of CRP or a regulatory subunit of cAMP-dependent protein kinases n=1 Tax=Pelosinus propionicus DSM 13327 TaxID=1123291 RepID=A0A1I4Q255_9FIRM|nr:Crp/Fnr family transcriptional regulator [Pelosinus propionicus]SFM34139.1 cAMP-binding domain of CRP or a regulatory subunit of cAMP-dependent protein kinases [Pelosinus propionicus DSM 13327]
MKLDHIHIYEYIQEYLNEIAVINYKKGQYITRSDETFTEVFFILSGNVKVECLTEYGKVFLVDELSENEFVGKFSYMYEQSLLCDIKATSDVCLLKIHKDTFNKLQGNSDFLKVFLFKTSKRIYYMYKKLMMKNLFSLEEMFAFHLLKNSENDRFEFKNISALCDIFSISRKGLYNVLNTFVKKNYIKKDKNSITIIDKKQLFDLAMHVRAFNRINDSKIKFNI